MENRFKEQQLELFSDRTSTHTFEGNQLRLWFSSLAYVLMHTLREHCLATTELHSAQVGTIRTNRYSNWGREYLLAPDGFLFLLAVVVPTKIFLLPPTDVFRLSPIRVKSACSCFTISCF